MKRVTDNFCKLMLIFGLLASVSFPAAGLTRATANDLDKPGFAIDKDVVVDQYSQLAAKYLKDCDRWDEGSRSSGAGLKRCLTIARELLDKFDGFVQRVESISSKAKNEKEWTKQLDDDFEKNAAKRGFDSSLINKVKQNGGFREHFQKRLNESKTVKSDFQAEIEALEAAVQNSGPAEDLLVMRISYSPSTATSPVGARLRKALKWVQDQVDTAFYIAEYFAGAV